MNIICYINKLSLGGAERVMSVLANSLVERGHYMTLVTDYSMDMEYLLHEKVDRRVIDGAFQKENRGNSLKRTLHRLYYLRALCKEKKADILVSFIREANLRALLAAGLTSTKNLISVRIDPKVAYRTSAIAWFVCAIYRMTDGCVFQTEEAQAWYPAAIQKKSRIILNPISPVFFESEPSKQRIKRLVTCGRLSKQKNHELLIRAFVAMDKQYQDYELYIYGEGSDHDRLQALIDELGQADRIVLAGRSNNVPQTIRDALAFVLSSDFEGLPNALMEAMALGVPVISTDCSGGGARMLIRDGENGRLTPCRDIRALTMAMEACLGDMVQTEKMATQARSDAESFRADKVVDDWEAYIRDLAARKR